MRKLRQDCNLELESDRKMRLIWQKSHGVMVLRNDYEDVLPYVQCAYMLTILSANPCLIFSLVLVADFYTANLNDLKNSSHLIC